MRRTGKILDPKLRTIKQEQQAYRDQRGPMVDMMPGFNWGEIAAQRGRLMPGRKNIRDLMNRRPDDGTNGQ